MDDHYRAHRLNEIASRVRRERRHFRELAAAKREWAARRDGTQGAAGACRKLSVVNGEIVIEVIQAATDHSSQ